MVKWPERASQEESGAARRDGYVPGRRKLLGGRTAFRAEAGAEGTWEQAGLGPQAVAA